MIIIKEKLYLPAIVVAQFLCTSLWFAGNAVFEQVIHGETNSLLAHVTSAVQFGFISGTLIYALCAISDKHSPSKVYFISAILGCITNCCLLIPDISVIGFITSRFLTGFFLAGIYPVGLKIAADHFDKNLGPALGYLIGALVLGTALPHLLKANSDVIDWKGIIMITSILSFIGGGMVYILVPDGPFRINNAKRKFSLSTRIFKNARFRKVVAAYLGHNWELYALWAFIPVILKKSLSEIQDSGSYLEVLSFFTIGFGFFGCITGGYLSFHFPARKIAAVLLAISSTCCVMSPILLQFSNPYLITSFLLIWSFSAVADSPSHAVLMSRNASVELRGASLTIANCLGFTITICSIQLLSLLTEFMPLEYVFIFLSPGPIFSLVRLIKK